MGRDSRRRADARRTREQRPAAQHDAPAVATPPPVRVHLVVDRSGPVCGTTTPNPSTSLSLNDVTCVHCRARVFLNNLITTI